MAKGIVIQKPNHYMVNIKAYGAKGDNATDDTNAFVQAIADAPWGGTIFVPNGIYLVSNVTVTKPINLIGESKTATTLKNTTANPCIILAEGVERGTIKDIGIWGNGTLIDGSDSTSGYGIVFNHNCCMWHLTDVYMRFHGSHALYKNPTGNLNNIVIERCEIEYNKGDGVHFIAENSGGQLNAIFINSCNFSGNQNGITVWGNNVNIRDNTIQGNRSAGIRMSCDDIPDPDAYSCEAVVIENNYFELNADGFIYAKADYGGRVRYIVGLKILNNYGSLSSANVNSGITAMIRVIGGGYPSGFVRNFVYDNSSFGSSTLNYLEADNALGDDSYIFFNTRTDLIQNKLIGLGEAQVVTRKEKCISGYMFAKGVGWTNIEKSDNITTSPMPVTFPLFLSAWEIVRGYGIYVNTDSTNYTVKFELYARDGKTGVGAYTLYGYEDNISMTSSGFATNTDAGTPIRLDNTHGDMYCKVTITNTSPGTYLYLGNLYIYYV